MKPSLAVVLFLFSSSSVFSQRESISLNGAWNFAVDSSGAGTRESWSTRGLPDEVSRAVQVPHTWNVETGTEVYGGVGWYEKKLDVPARWNGRLLRLQFEAVYHTATIWINGRIAGEHRGSGYTPFVIDGTGLLIPGTTNSITIRVDNSFSRSAVPFMRSYDWPNDGGIIRPVRLVATGRPAIERVRVWAHPEIRGSADRLRGTLRIALRVLEMQGVDRSRVRCVLEVISPDGVPGALVARQVFRPEFTGNEAVVTMAIDAIRLWRCDDPALYGLQMTLMVDGERTDSVATTFGFRDVHTRGTTMVMNGEPIRLMGVEWMPGSNPRFGMAEPESEMGLSLARMRSVNAIFTRFHWQQADAVFDWCDRHGIVVQEELPLWGNGVPLNDTTMAIARSQLREMIEAHANHPSIVMWGVGNELASTSRRIIDSVQMLISVARRLDPGRLVNYVSNRLSLGEGLDASATGDILMWNEYQDTWYLSDPSEIRKALDSIHAAYPAKPIVISEYGLCEPANQGGDERRTRDLIYHTAIFENTPYVAGAIYFCLNDYRTHFGEEGSGANRRRVHGVFDFSGSAKPSAAMLRWISSPIEILNVGWKTSHRFEITLIGSAGLPSYPLRGYSLYWSQAGEDPLTRGAREAIPDLLPGEKVQVPLDADLGPRIEIAITRPTGEVIATRQFDVRP